jgi:hypothetical protein
MRVRVARAVVMFVSLPTLVLASCHLVGGTEDLYIDPAFHEQGDGGAAVTSGGGDGGATTTTTTTSSTGGSGGTIDICDPTECPGEDTDCRKVACVNNECGASNVEPEMGCTDDGGSYCDGLGNCVECINDMHCPTDWKCQTNVCHAPGCGDGMMNGDESDVDCGGSCGPCPLGDGCGGPQDCQSGICASMTCASCETEGCESTEWCETNVGACRPKGNLFDNCSDDEQCLSGCCAFWCLVCE